MPPFEIENLKSLKQLEGREFPATDWFVVTQDRIQKFADATEDRQWIHLDPERAQRESTFGGSIAHGFLTLSLLSYWMKQAIQIRSGLAMAVNYGLNKVRFPSAVRAGSQVRARVTLLSAKESPEFVDATFLIHVESQGFESQDVESQGVHSKSSSKPCCVAEWLVRYYPK
jgi:acyl dehydratase